MTKINVKSKEYLSKDILDEDFIRTFIAVYRVQQFLGSCRVDAKDRFITTPTPYQKFHTIICILLTIAINIFIVKDYNNVINDATIYGLSVAALTVHFCIYLCHVIHVRFRNTHKNVEFHVQMQKIDRNMRIDKNRVIYVILRNFNNGSVGCVLLVYIVLVVVAAVRQDWMYLAFVGSAYTQLTFIIELMYCSGLIVYYVLRLRFINGIMKNYLSNGKDNTESTGQIFSRRNMTRLAAASHSFETSETNDYLRDLFNCFETFQELYRFQLLMFSLKLVVMSLLVFELVLFSIQRSKMYLIETISLILLMAVDVLIAVVLGFRFELLFREVSETKRVAIAVMVHQQDGPLRQKARTMLKIIEETPPVFSVYDMWEMNAGIFLTMFSMVTSLIVTLLQFAFL